MRFASPDALVAAYFAALEAVTSLPAQRLSETVEVCARCGGPKSQRKGCAGDLFDSCADCGESWRPVEVEVGLIRAAIGLRPDVAEWGLISRLDRLRPLRALVEPRPRDYTRAEWRQALVLWGLYLHPCCGTYVAAARMAQEAMEDASWTRGKVEREIEAARAVVAHRMGRREKVWLVSKKH